MHFIIQFNIIMHNISLAIDNVYRAAKIKGADQLAGSSAQSKQPLIKKI